jgi:hypothetical protein
MCYVRPSDSILIRQILFSFLYLSVIISAVSFGLESDGYKDLVSLMGQRYFFQNQSFIWL